MNLAGVERVFELEEEIERMRRRMRNLERQAERVRDELSEELERVRRSLKHELVLYEPPSQALTPRKAGGRSVRIPVRRPR
jgi:MerR family transcriptional regulator, heat shock protein HspR